MRLLHNTHENLLYTIFGGESGEDSVFVSAELESFDKRLNCKAVEGLVVDNQDFHVAVGWWTLDI